ncbi:MAG: DUF2164 domain-containing protein [Deltaproteobacteria bacterium]|nr:DUF2164 domain-containing protein [Deltaproteobacteria bacterium]MBW2416631.1 DUF2164 domain-containing protein [Deltaproteobacteria bacterium]
MAIEFERDVVKAIVPSIQRYFSEKLDSQIGNLDAEFLLEFFLKEAGPLIYNRAIREAQAVLGERVAELDGDCWEPEEGYWPGSSASEDE